MKKLLLACQKFLLCFAFLLVGMAAQGQTPTYKLSIVNESQPSPNVYEFDVYISSTSTTPFLLSNTQFGIAYDTSILDGGIVLAANFERIAGTSDFPSGYTTASTNAGVQISSLNGVNVRYLNMAASTIPASPGAATTVPDLSANCAAPGLRISRFRLTSSKAFKANSTCKHLFSTATGAGRTNTVISAFIGTSSIAITNPASNFGYNQVGTCTQNIVLSPASTCAISVDIVPVPVTCFGGNDGGALITISGAGAAAPGTYSLDGAPPVAYNTNPFSIPGLTAGAHSIEMITPCTSASTPFTIGGPAGPSESTETQSACDSYTWSQDGQTYTTSGTYTASGTVAGCPHTYILNLTITPSTSNATTVAACDTYTWTQNGMTYTASGTYSDVVGCHTETLNLTITASSSNTTTVSACDSYTWSQNGATYTSSGTQTDVVGCHTEILELTITASTSNSTTVSACDTYTWVVDGNTYTTSGTYTSVVGCHTETLNLTITASTSSSTTASACDSYTWSQNGMTYTTSGTYTDVVGCHTETLVLTVTASTSNSATASACDSYTWSQNGMTYTASGTYTDVVGCHTEILNLTITPSTPNSTTVSACDSYTWSVDGQTYTASGTYTSVTGCNTETLELTITASTSNTTTASECDTYTWSVNSQTYTASGTYTSVTGCHTEILNLTITSSTSNSTTASGCDSYTWSVNSQTYTASGTYTSVSGCHTETLVLTVEASSSNSTTASACDSYTWSVNSQTYTVSGTYTDVVGCHTETLVLTITASTSNSTTASACDSYTWSVNSQTYTASGTYTDVAGCHTETLILTITASTSNSTTAAACDSYTWSQNGMTYTASGTYTDVVGCHTETLVLTITPTTSNSTNVTGCGTYTWSVNGQTYTTGGTYSNTVGCHTEIIVLTINNVVVTATPTGTIQCFGGMVAVNVSATGGSSPYTGSGSFLQSSGSFTYVVTDNAGCTGSATVTLSQPSKVEGTTSSTPTSCGASDGTATVSPSGGAGGYTYLWSDGAAQTTATATGLMAGSYTVTITDANGCTGTASATVLGAGGEPDPAGAIQGPAGACAGSCLTYMIAPVSGATSYAWILPTGATGTSTSNSITICFDNTFLGGFICVTPENTCGTGTNSCLNIPVFTVRPAQPGFIIGNPNPCGPTVETYSIPLSNNAVNYVWSVTGAGVTILSGQGSNSVQVSFPVGFGQAVIGVYAENCKGQTSRRSTTLTGIPTHSSPLTGPGYVCAGTAGVAYSISAAIGAGSSYVWSTTGDISVAGPQGSTAMNFDFGPSFTTGTIMVTTSSSCGDFTRTFTIRSTPGQPGSIAGPASNLCGQLGVTYSIAAVATATSYNWTVPAGVLMTTPNGGTSITVDFTPAFTGTGNLCVSAVSACGSSIARCYSITALTTPPSSPSGPASVCKTSASVAYTLTPVAGAVSYLWSISGGASISPSGSSATVNFNSAVSTTAVITVNAVNACGYSQPGKKIIAVNLGCRDASDLNSTSSVNFEAYPNPTHGLVNVNFTAEKSAKYSVKVTDLLGNVVISDVISASEGVNMQELNLSNVARGMYLLSIETDGTTPQTIRVVVE